MYFNTHVEKPFVCPSRCTHVDLISVDVSCGSHFELGASLNFYCTSAAAEVSLCVLGVLVVYTFRIFFKLEATHLPKARHERKEISA